MYAQSTFNDWNKTLVYVQENIRIVIITWNLLGSIPPQQELIKLLRSPIFNEYPQVIFFATQQCQRPLSVSFFCQDKSNWQSIIENILMNKYKLHSSMTMQGLHLAFFAKNNIFTTVTLDQKKYLKAGFLNLVGNKGAISLEVNIYGQSIQVINCHLAPHQNQSSKRNETVLRIMQQLVSKDLKTEVFFCGDLNYRIEISQQEYKRMIEGKENSQVVMNYKSMIKKDQLKIQAPLAKTFLKNFYQGKIYFPPTYKISVNGDQYCRERIPGWTDRILHRQGRARQNLYLCQYDIKGSDHRPVLATYNLPIQQGLSVFPDDFVGVESSSKCCNLI